jgi:hypothetical protein
VLPMPIDKLGTVRYSQGPHTSDFKAAGANGITITNAGKGVLSSIDLSYAGYVNAPISGELKIFKNCGAGGAIVFIRNANGYAVGVTHIILAAGLTDKLPITQGKSLGKTIAPQNNSCGLSTGHHVHLTLMTWAAGTNKFTELAFTNVYVGQWMVQGTRMRSALTYTDVIAGDGKYLNDIAKITSVRSGKVIDAWTAGTQIWTSSSGNLNQQWQIIRALNDPGYYYLRSVSRGKCMVAPDNSSGTLIAIATCWAENQKFKFVPVPNVPGKYAIQSKTSGKVLDVITDWNDPNSGKANGTRIQQWDAFYGNNQQWTLSKP